MERLVIRGSVRQFLLFSVWSLLFVLAGLFLLTMTDVPPWIGWTSIIFFGAGALVFLREVCDSRPRLIIDEQGILDRTLAVGVIRWSDIEGAYARSIQGVDFICLELRNADLYLRRLSPLKRVMTRFNQALGFTPLSLNLSGIHGMTDRILDVILQKSAQYRHGRS